MVEGQKRLTDENMVIRRVRENDGDAEQSGGVVCGRGGSGWSQAGEGDALARRLCCGRCSMGGAGHTELLGFRFRDVLEGWS